MTAEARHTGQPKEPQTPEIQPVRELLPITVQREPEAGLVDFKIPVRSESGNYDLYIQYPDPENTIESANIQMSFNLPTRDGESPSLYRLGSLEYSQNGLFVTGAIGNSFDEKHRGGLWTINFTPSENPWEIPEIEIKKTWSFNAVESEFTYVHPNYLEIRHERKDSDLRKSFWIPRSLSREMRYALEQAAVHGLDDITEAFFRQPLEMHISYADKRYLNPIGQRTPTTRKDILIKSFVTDDTGILAGAQNRS